MSNMLYKPEEGQAIVNALNALSAEVRNATITSPSLADPLAPTPFSPTTQALDDALAGFEPLPYSESDVLAVITKVKKAAEDENRAEKFGIRANMVLNAIIGLVPKLFAVA